MGCVIGIFYGSTTCYTEMAAEKIQEHLQKQLAVDVPIFDIKCTSLDRVQEFDFIIFGISTWDFGELQEDWESCWDDISSLNLKNKTIALFGLGDQYGYADWFQDAMGMLYEQLMLLGSHCVGFWPNEGYEFTASKALTEDNSFFVGLPLDDENQFDQTDERIKTWCSQLIDEINS